MMGQSEALCSSLIIIITLILQLHNVTGPFTSHSKLCCVSQNYFPQPNRHFYAFLHLIYCARSRTEYHWRCSKLDISCMAAAPNSRQWFPFFQSKKKQNKQKQTLQQHLPPHGWLAVAVRVGHDQLSWQLPHALSLELSLFFTFFVFGLSFLLQSNCLRRIHIQYGEAHA